MSFTVGTMKDKRRYISMKAKRHFISKKAPFRWRNRRAIFRGNSNEERVLSFYVILLVYQLVIAIIVDVIATDAETIAITLQSFVLLFDFCNLFSNSLYRIS